jgi:general secretion pathway protein K
MNIRLKTPTSALLRSTRSQSGIALIIVLIVIVVLAGMASGFAWFMKVEMKLATNHLSDSELEWLGRSGVELARYVVGQQLNINEPCDCLNQKWAGGPGQTNQLLENVFLDDNYLGNGVFSVYITDNERKMNINTATDVLIENALSVMGVDATLASTISDSILDWRDDDDDAKLSGAEDEYYLGLMPPYYCKNGPLDDISELLLIQGVDPELYYGIARLEGRSPQSTFVDTDEMRIGQDRYSDEMVFEGGLMDLFCTLSSGTVNINTAPAEVLQMLPDMTPEIANEIISYRNGLDGVEATEDDIQISNINMLMQIGGIPEAVIQQLGAFCGFRSTVFEVEVVAEIEGQQRTFSSMLHRVSAKDVRILYFQWK